MVELPAHHHLNHKPAILQLVQLTVSTLGMHGELVIKLVEEALKTEP